MLYFISQHKPICLILDNIYIMQSSQADQAVAAIDALIKKTKPNTSTPMKSALVGLFTADAEGELRYSGCIGILHLDMDRHLKTTVLRIYDLQTIKLVFQVEMFYGFAAMYKQRSPIFYTFQYPRGVIGFLFKSKEEAEMMKIKINSQSPSTAEYEQIKKKRIEEMKQKKKQGGLFYKIKGFFNQEQKHEQHESVVIEVHKQKSITFDTESGSFNTDNIPPEWQELFDQLHLSKEDLKDKQVVNLIVEETIMQQVKAEAYKSDNIKLQKQIRQAEDQQKKYYDQCRKSNLNNLPPPPPPPPLLGPPPLDMPSSNQPRASFASKRGNLMEEIRNNNLKLKHVETTNKAINLDLSNMNRQDRNDHAERLRLKLQMRKQALNRRKASDEEDSD